MQISPNFAFLKVHDLQLVRLGSQAERYFSDDPNTCLLKLRQFGELLAKLVAAKAGLYENPEENQMDLLRRLKARGVVGEEALRLFHELRKTGNQASHSLSGEHRTALSHLKYARELGIWFHRSYGRQPQFKAGAFVPPPDPAQETTALRQELDRLRAELETHRTSAEAAQAAAVEEAELRQVAEELLQEAEARQEEIEAKLACLQAETVAQPPQEVQEVIAAANHLGDRLELDERETRRLIDAQLRAAGWEADTETLCYARGTRPQKGRYLAIAEWQTDSGAADYILFAGLQAIAVVEAKRSSVDVPGAVMQAKRYSRDMQLQEDAAFIGTGWGAYRVPFAFATNGRPYLEQLRTASGIWFCDLRHPQNLSRPLQTWYSPQDLLDTLGQDREAAQQRLATEGFAYNFELRPYQQQAIQAVEAALAKDVRTVLLAMATGTGKTKTSIALIYRLLKTKRFRRILFLVDRTALGEQAANAFKDTRMENLQTFTDIFEVKELKDTEPDRDTKVHIATVQGMVKRLLYPTDNAPTLTAGQYDCIIVDECHRGYLLDRDLSDAELTFRDEQDYISKYRRVLDFFDAVKIGLTATPALHTTQIFGEPAFFYSYREAVIDGYLIDHEPPTRIITRLSEEGIGWRTGEMLEIYDTQSGEVDVTYAPDDIHLEVEQFNRRVIAPDFNRVVCEELATHLDPSHLGKTLIFCATDRHADMVVDLLKQALTQAYEGIEDDAVVKITGKADKPLEQIRRFKNEVNPKFVATVDLLTTGIDVPSICNLVFLRRVNSRILYEQMLGRATRRCDEINKEMFRVFDAVNLYENMAAVTDMKPVAVNPSISFAQLVRELDTATQSLDAANRSEAIAAILDQLLAKLQRKRRHLSQEQTEAIAQEAGMPVDDIAQHLKDLAKDSSPEAAAAWLRQHAKLAEWLDRRDGSPAPVFLSRHQDELRRVEQGYGTATRPEDYLESFAAFLNENSNTLPALLAIAQRPRDLTRQQLKELRLALSEAGFTEATLQAAWRAATNEDIAASIVGFIRQAALGDALMPFSDRVDRAMQEILASRYWTEPQRKWLERIGKQLKKEFVVDRAALDEGAFKAEGGFKRINKLFNGQLESILADICDRLWQQAS